MAATWPFLNPLRKRWGHVFSNPDIPEDTPYMAELRELDPEFDGIELFMNPYDEETFSILDDIVQICQGLQVRHTDEQPPKQSAWLDDRAYLSYYPNEQFQTPPDEARVDDNLVRPALRDSQENFNTRSAHDVQLADLDENSQARTLSAGVPTSRRYIPDSRRYQLPLTAKNLRVHLEKKRFNLDNQPDADRRLIYIANPDEADILAVVDTTPQHQHEAVRDLITKFFSFETSIKASITTRGQPIYRLECHLPYFALRRTKFAPKETTNNPHRDWIDLSFMADVGDDTSLGIHPAQISVVLCGTSEVRYTVHCFEDTKFDTDRDMGNDEFSLTGFQADQIAKGKADANLPIWDPREYFMHVLLIRMNQIQMEWNQLVRKVESGFQKYSTGRSPFVHNNIVAETYYTQSMLQLLSKLLQKIEETNYTWDRFTEPHGDVGYFSDLDSVSPTTKAHVELMYYEIQETARDLKCFQKRLERVQIQCEKMEKSLESHFSMGNNKNTELTILYICPISVVCSYFAIPVPIMSFERNEKSFIGAICVITAIIYILRFSHQLWWMSIISRRAKAAWQGDRTNTTKNTSGHTVIRRRKTHSWFRSVEEARKP